jgi:hypothetical protein
VEQERLAGGIQELHPYSLHEPRAVALRRRLRGCAWQASGKHEDQ